MAQETSVKRPNARILIGGEAGQGLGTIGQILARCFVRAGYDIVVTQSYMSRIRGGHNTFAIRVSVDKISAPREGADLLVALNRETVELYKNELSDGSVILADESYAAECKHCIGVPFGELGPARTANVAALGVLTSFLGMDKDLVTKTVDDVLGKKDSETAKSNQDTLGKAFEWASKRESTDFQLEVPTVTGKRMMLNGNDAIALGAISAGLKFAAFYPMTPSTSVNLALIKHARDMDIIVEQAEGEIAAINMAIGASYAGAPSMVATSGGGFALMTEGVSLAAATETPVVIVVAQRPGPATGLPTRTEQADLNFVLFSGHGEFPRAIFAPGSPEECFELTRKAFELAEKYQGPMFILTDQFLADSYRAVELFDEECLPTVRPGDNKPISLPYQRFALTESGVSPRLIPGSSEHLVVVDSDEHTEDGHLTEDLAIRKRMVEKRLRKGKGILSEVIPPVYNGDEEPEVLLVSWGSSMGAVLESAEEIRANGTRAAMLHFPQVWPLVGENFLPYLEMATEVVSVEGNATGQFADLIRRQTGFNIERRVIRYDGLPITPEYILRELNR